MHVIIANLQIRISSQTFKSEILTNQTTAILDFCAWPMSLLLVFISKECFADLVNHELVPMEDTKWMVGPGIAAIANWTSLVL